jgi:hypothetical protein
VVGDCKEDGEWRISSRIGGEYKTNSTQRERGLAPGIKVKRQSQKTESKGKTWRKERNDKANHVLPTAGQEVLCAATREERW